VLDRIIRKVRYLGIVSEYNRYQKSRPHHLEIFSNDRTEYGISIAIQTPAADIVNLHWVANFVDHESFFRNIQTGTGFVWTLHDMNPFTGGCHYSLGCEKYKHKCGDCPQLGSDREGDLSRDIWLRKKRILENIPRTRLNIVAPSRWLAEEAAASSLLEKFQISVIPNGIDTRVFRPLTKKLARKELHIPADAKVLLFVSDSIQNHRKGFTYLLRALEKISNINELFLATIGNGDFGTQDLAADITNFGHIENESQMVLIYSAADVFVIPSLQDNLPNTVLEAMACGIPTIGFETGGIPDMIQPDITGKLVTPEDIYMLAQVINNLLEDSDKLRTMSRNCRKAAVENYSLNIQSARYESLYQVQLENMCRNTP